MFYFYLVIAFIELSHWSNHPMSNSIVLLGFSLPCSWLKGLQVNPISAREGGWNPPPSRFSLAIATKINRSTPNFLTFNFYYRDIIWPNIKLITCQGVTWSLFCRKQFVSLYFHWIFMFYFFFFWHLYSVLISAFWWKNILWLSFYEFNKKILMMSAFWKRSEILMILVASAAQNLIVSLEIWLFSD